jgi:hypothetical protein
MDFKFSRDLKHSDIEIRDDFTASALHKDDYKIGLIEPCINTNEKQNVKIKF